MLLHNRRIAEPPEKEKKYKEQLAAMLKKNN